MYHTIYLMDTYNKFVICGRDCNGHESMIFACFDSFDSCMQYLNRKGKSLTGNKAFDIQTFRINEDDQESSMFNATFEHVELFNHLYSMGGVDAICTHKGAIHIACIERNKDFSEVYEWLSETYV